MPLVILLNGPPGIGKSTIASRYVDEHPGTLNLDIDRVRHLIGGWRSDFTGVGEIVRPVAVAMLQAHLYGGRDVVMPQYLSSTYEVEMFKGAARVAGADFVELVLMADRDESVGRFLRETDDPWRQEIQRIVAEDGGVEQLRLLHHELRVGLAERPNAVLLDSTDGNVDASFTAVLKALGHRTG